MLKEIGAKSVEVRGDSQIVIKQSMREYRCMSFALVPYCTAARELFKDFKEVTLEYVPRDMN